MQLDDHQRETLFIKSWHILEDYAYEIAKDHGWWDNPREDGTLIALMHAELSEVLECLRKGEDEPSSHIPEFKGVEEELADVVIRIMDFSERKGYRVGEAIVAKMAFNRTREYKHGGKAF